MATYTIISRTFLENNWAISTQSLKKHSLFLWLTISSPSNLSYGRSKKICIKVFTEELFKLSRVRNLNKKFTKYSVSQNKTKKKHRSQSTKLVGKVICYDLQFEKHCSKLCWLSSQRFLDGESESYLIYTGRKVIPGNGDDRPNSMEMARKKQRKTHLRCLGDTNRFFGWNGTCISLGCEVLRGQKVYCQTIMNSES